MQPTAIIIARAEFVKSAPWMRRLTISVPVAILPEAPTLIFLRSPAPTSALCTIISPWVSGSPTLSSNSSGAAPVPPSDPSTMMKSGRISVSTMALTIERNSVREPTQSLKPAGLPPESSRILRTNWSSSIGVENTL